jgi:enoyl-CoA hydratase/carnithine racemase
LLGLAARGRVIACGKGFHREPLDAKSALAAGLVSKVVTFGELIKEVTSLLPASRQIRRRCCAGQKRLLRAGQNSSLNEILELSADYQALAHHKADHDEALVAIREKRLPIFSGN